MSRFSNFVGYLKVKDGTVTRGMCGFCKSTNVKTVDRITTCNDCGTTNANSFITRKGKKKKNVSG